VRVPPSFYRGLLLFGSADGWVYCLRARDGKLVWRLRAAPAERKVVAFGQIESAWPVNSGVVVQKGRAYFLAGRSSHLDGGLFLYAVDVATGRVLHWRRLEGHHLNVKNIEDNIWPKQGILADLLQGDGEFIYLRHRRFDPSLRDAKGDTLRPRVGATTFLDDTYFKRTPWFVGTMRNWGRIVALGPEGRAFIARMFRSLRCLDPKNFYTPGQGFTFLARRLGRLRQKDLWSVKVPIRVRALLVSGDVVWLSGPPDKILPRDPFATFEGRSEGLLWALSARDGRKLAEHTIERPPVFNGMAVGEGRLYIATTGGSLLCLGPKRGSKQRGRG